jgi:hypothetical protein
MYQATSANRPKGVAVNCRCLGISSALRNRTDGSPFRLQQEAGTVKPIRLRDEQRGRLVALDAAIVYRGAGPLRYVVRERADLYSRRSGSTFPHNEFRLELVLLDRLNTAIVDLRQQVFST